MRTPWASFRYTWLFPSPDKSVGAKDTQKGPGVSCCKPGTLVDSAPIIQSTRVDRDGPNYQSDLSDLPNQGDYIRERRTLASNGISALWIDSTVSDVLEFGHFTAARTKTPQADGTCAANFAAHNRRHENRSAALIYIKFWMGNALRRYGYYVARTGARR